MTAVQLPTVLLVDDDPIVLKSLGEVLRSFDLDVHAVQSGAAALAFLETNHAAVGMLITDFKMPSMDGFELARRVHELYPSLPIACVSSFFDGNERIQAAPAFLKTAVKPADSRDVAELLKCFSPGGPSAGG